jgi:hypothetical protein
MSELANDTAWEDPIVAEVRATREALFAQAGFDIHELCRRVRARQAESGNVVVSLRERAEAGRGDERPKR